MVESDGLLNRYTFQRVSQVRILSLPPWKIAEYWFVGSVWKADCPSGHGSSILLSSARCRLGVDSDIELL